MDNEKTKHQAAGIRLVQQFVREHWGSAWHPVEAMHDDGVDGVVFIRKIFKKKTIDTGAMVFVQVKGGDGYRRDAKKRPDFIGVNVGQEYIVEHRPRWNRLPGPVILVYVDPSTDALMPHAWWTDLRAESSYCSENKNIILVPKVQRFGAHSKGHIKRLCGVVPTDARLPVIRASRKDVCYFSLSEPLKKRAKEFYDLWGKTPVGERTNPVLGEVSPTRIGWRHISRKGRRPERIHQSWQLLGIAKRMIQETTAGTSLGRSSVLIAADKSTVIKDYVGLRSRVIFPHRHEGVIQVVMRRVRRISPAGSTVSQKIYFYSIYEIRQSLNAIRA
ncbi:MAG: DUF4365 domain-containing protein [Deltaproteobacteria bacterium]|nr:DUF4365 domain-containing protein [Deltaproteobacteria bacterium]